MANKNIIWQIAIDGPAGVGKSTVAKKLAQILNFKYIDTGAMYRAITYLVINSKVDLADLDKIYDLTSKANIEFKQVDNQELVYINNIDVTQAIRQDSVNKLVSTISAQKLVRSVLVEKQKILAGLHSTIMDGRDIGTVVMPNAQLKIYLEASSLVRAQRRYLQLINQGYTADIDKIQAMIELRDKQDMERLASPLKPAIDAMVVNTDNLNQDEVIDTIIKAFNKICSGVKLA